MKFVFIVPSLFCALAYLSSAAQTVSNVNASMDDQKVTIKYDLASNNPNDRFTIKCFYSTNNGQTYPNEIASFTGAVGPGQLGGMSKVIVWDVKKDLSDFDGNLKFKVLATVPENYFPGKSISIQLLKLQKDNGKILRLQGYFFGSKKTKMNLQLNSLIRATGGETYKLTGGKIDNQIFTAGFDVAEGDSHFFDLLFYPINPDENAPGSAVIDLAFFVFTEEKINMPGLNLKISR